MSGTRMTHRKAILHRCRSSAGNDTARPIAGVDKLTAVAISDCSCSKGRPVVHLTPIAPSNAEAGSWDLAAAPPQGMSSSP